MARYRASVPSVRGAQETFDYLADFSSVAEWDPGVKAARRLDDGPLGVGSRFAVTTTLFGLVDNELTYEITAYDRDARHVVLDAETKTLTSHDVIDVAADGTVTYDADLQLKGVFRVNELGLKLLFKVLGDRAAGGLRDTLSR